MVAAVEFTPLKEFCSFPPKPLELLQRYLAERRDERDLDQIVNELEEDYERAFKAGMCRFYKRKTVYPSRYKKDDDSPIEVTLRKSSYAGKSMFLYFVDLNGNQIAPNRCLEEFGFLGTWHAALAELKALALPEAWDVQPQYASSQSREDEVLCQYLRYTFYRLMQEDKIVISEGQTFAAFNTGLVDTGYNDIFACFLPNMGGVTPWRLVGFCTAASRGTGKLLVRELKELPKRAEYIQCLDDIYFTTSRVILPDWEHILIDNLSRFPVKFLKQVFSQNKAVMSLLSKLESSADKEQHLAGIKQHLMSNSDSFVVLKHQLQSAIDISVKHVETDYSLAVPAYFPRGRRMALLLPLWLLGNRQPDLALVVEPLKSGSYQGHTVLTIAQAYIDARLIGHVSSSWLRNICE